MFKGRLHILALLATIVWFVGVNHCAWEPVFAVNNQAQSDCGSHSNADPESHKEGSPCTTTILNAKPQTEIAAVNAAIPVLTTISYLLLSPDSKHFKVFLPALPTIPQASILNPLLSLSIASNAPPHKSA